MNINKNHIILISIFTLLFSIGIYFISQAFDSEKYYYVTNLKRVTINIPEDSDIEDVIYLLEENGDLEGELIFKVIAAAKGYSQNIKPGKIILEGRYSLNTLINNLKISPKITINLQIPENIRKIDFMIMILEDSLGLDSCSIRNYIDSSDFLINNNLTWKTLPSLFIPNTYEVYKNTSPEQFLSRMVLEHESFWNKERTRKCDSLGMTKIDISTLASIIEEEQDKRIDEKPMIAGLYLNRIDQGIKLQSDPTVIFANNDFKIKRVLYKHLEFESPYNTYIYHGLPPGPICIPSINSIDAVLNAISHEYIFMCAKGDGSGLHNFAKTNREHINNRRRYKRNQNFN